MNTIDYKTKTIIEARENLSLAGWWPVAADIGYSSVKIFAPNMIASFPSYARQVAYGTADNPIGGLEQTSIAYRDEEGHEYLVGEAAQASIRSGEADSSTAALYIRDRYFSDEFKVISRVGLALGMSKNKFGSPEGKKLFIQTGLPSEYSADRNDLITALSGSHKFQIKLGTGEWKEYETEVTEDIVGVMDQPMGTLISVSTGKDGNPIAEAKKYLSSNILIIDDGFGTLDTNEIAGHHIRTSKTWANLGMHRVLEEASNIIKVEHDTIIPVPAMQKVLQDGSFRTKFNRVTRQNDIINFAPILERANQMICSEAIKVIDGFYNYLQDQDYVVLTGGTTGAAWYDMFVDSYKNSKVQFIRGTQNDNVPAIFSNVRGYYMQIYNTLKRLAA